MDIFFEELQSSMLNLTILEVMGVFFGLFSVWFAKKENILVFPTGIISVLIYVYLCFQIKLYADMGINAYYFFMSIYGWYVWSRRDEKQHSTPISICSKTDWIICLITFFISFLLLFFILNHLTDSDVPFWDSLTTALFFMGMWLMAKKKIENWIVWIVADVISIPLYFYKGLQLTSIQFLIFLILAVLGYISWKRSLTLRTA